MKKKIIISMVSLIVIVIIVLGFIFINRTNTIMIDINPSIEIKVKNKKVIDLIPINEDAIWLVENEKLKGKDVSSVLKKIVGLIVDRGYTPEGEASIILYSDGISSNKIEKELKDYFNEKEVETNIIVIKNITKEDKELAKKYNISPSKAAYINSIKKSNNKVEIKDLIDSSVETLNYTKEEGLYCDKGYFLEGHDCLKEIKRVDAISSKVCPDASYEYNGSCYEESPSKKGTKDICHNNLKLVDGNCIMEDIIESVPNCGENNYDFEQDKCIELVYVEDGIEFCRDPGRTLYEHKCLATKPTINGGCLGSDALIGGNCVNLVDDYYMAEWKCSNGEVLSSDNGSLKYGDTKCYEKKYVDVEKRECPEDYKLQGTKCYLKRVEKPMKERICDSGLTKVDNERCINLNKTVEREDGYICTDKEARLENNKCISYEAKAAKHK